ncbi:hypothetical protein HYH03_008553 [Edaphochlamys debaryana]|uniref:Uncharacterized protein n=1 Tax=Edaphochlamys debaryana TaxID=47281 RepID=A0A835XZK1_9CHLO|nr:hypothetical protein HYH03_008553 [Edaphochlamys debaryana]|eukprot:KAG2493126.1 hypothetical protein HYH03_008553 [Edaphochlamys debaryana]
MAAAGIKRRASDELHTTSEPRAPVVRRPNSATNSAPAAINASPNPCCTTNPCLDRRPQPGSPAPMPPSPAPLPPRVKSADQGAAPATETAPPRPTLLLQRLALESAGRLLPPACKPLELLHLHGGMVGLLYAPPPPSASVGAALCRGGALHDLGAFSTRADALQVLTHVPRLLATVKPAPPSSRGSGGAPAASPPRTPPAPLPATAASATAKAEATPAVPAPSPLARGSAAGRPAGNVMMRERGPAGPQQALGLMGPPKPRQAQAQVKTQAQALAQLQAEAQRQAQAQAAAQAQALAELQAHVQSRARALEQLRAQAQARGLCGLATRELGPWGVVMVGR